MLIISMQHTSKFPELVSKYLQSTLKVPANFGSRCLSNFPAFFREIQRFKWENNGAVITGELRAVKRGVINVVFRKAVGWSLRRREINKPPAAGFRIVATFNVSHPFAYRCRNKLHSAAFGCQFAVWKRERDVKLGNYNSAWPTYIFGIMLRTALYVTAVHVLFYSPRIELIRRKAPETEPFT